MKMDTHAHQFENEADGQTEHSGLVLTGKIFRVRQKNRIAFQDKPKPSKKENAHNLSTNNEPPRIARMLAFAHHMQNLIESGEVKDRAELARIFGISRARVTQLMDLTLLAPDIQEEILFSEKGGKVEAVTERSLRKISGMTEWGAQRSCLGRTLMVLK